MLAIPRLVSDLTYFYRPSLPFSLISPPSPFNSSYNFFTTAFDIRTGHNSLSFAVVFLSSSLFPSSLLSSHLIHSFHFATSSPPNSSLVYNEFLSSCDHNTLSRINARSATRFALNTFFNFSSKETALRPSSVNRNANILPQLQDESNAAGEEYSLRLPVPPSFYH